MVKRGIKQRMVVIPTFLSMRNMALANMTSK